MWMSRDTTLTTSAHQCQPSVVSDATFATSGPGNSDCTPQRRLCGKQNRYDPWLMEGYINPHPRAASNPLPIQPRRHCRGSRVCGAAEVAAPAQLALAEGHSPCNLDFR